MESDNKYIEKRKFPRFPAVNEYTIILNGKQHQGEIGNISLGGVYLSSISPKITQDDLFQDCEISMNLSGTEVPLPCSISFIAPKHSKIGSGIGIAFADIDEKSLTILKDFIDNIQPPL